MAHFAQLDDNNHVIQVIVVNDSDTCDHNGVEQESIGVAFCQMLFGGQWIQTSYNAKFRKNYAGIGYMYDSERDAFIPPQPYASWVLNEAACAWEAPVSMPTDGKRYQWNETTQAWEEREI